MAKPFDVSKFRKDITKSIDEKDHRRKLFAPTLETIEEFESWINQSFDNS